MSDWVEDDKATWELKAMSDDKVPDGFVLVPEVATRAMESAGAGHAYGGGPTRAALCWEAMVKAALEEEYDAKADRCR